VPCVQRAQGWRRRQAYDAPMTAGEGQPAKAQWVEDGYAGAEAGLQRLVFVVDDGDGDKIYGDKIYKGQWCDSVTIAADGTVTMLFDAPHKDTQERLVEMLRKSGVPPTGGGG
jgi:hypothetical protein